MVRGKYVTISVPENLAKDIDKIVKGKVKGYSSRAELVRDGIRQILKELSKK